MPEERKWFIPLNDMLVVLGVGDDTEEESVKGMEWVCASCG